MCWDEIFSSDGEVIMANELGHEERIVKIVFFILKRTYYRMIYLH